MVGKNAEMNVDNGSVKSLLSSPLLLVESMATAKKLWCFPKHAMRVILQISYKMA